MSTTNKNPYFEPSFDLSNRLYRLAWGIVWLLLFRCTPRFLGKWRIFLLRIFGAKIGGNVNIRSSVSIWSPKNIVIGCNVGIGDDVILYSMNTITIGNFCVISHRSQLCTGYHKHNSPDFELATAPITIDKSVWICTQAIILPGVNISEGCVVGAGSVISKNIDRKYEVWAGNPAIKKGIRNFEGEAK